MEMVAELARQHENHQVRLAKIKAEKDLHSIEIFRKQWGGAGLEVSCHNKCNNNRSIAYYNVNNICILCIK